LLETRHGLAAGTLRMEMMIEVTQALLGISGRSPLPEFLQACEGRCVAAHFGTYDFTASCNITAAYQTMAHPWCDLAKGMMMLAYANTGIFLSDGATNVMPVGPHKHAGLTAEQLAENRAVAHGAWQLARAHPPLATGGFYQG
jgi:malate synthase